MREADLSDVWDGSPNLGVGMPVNMTGPPVLPVLLHVVTQVLYVHVVHGVSVAGTGRYRYGPVMQIGDLSLISL